MITWPHISVLLTSDLDLDLGLKMSTASKASRLARVGNYELTPGYLGKGNFAVVRLGVHKLTRTSVAVKIVEKADLDEENLKKIRREIEIMQKLSHPSIIKLFQVSFWILSLLIFKNVCRFVQS